MKRLDFLGSSACALATVAMPGAIDWSFPGTLGACAQRLDATQPFASRHATWAMPAASTIKLLILLAATAKMERAGFSWSHELTVSRSDIVGASETFGTARPGERATLAALARACIAQSDNTAANVLADWTGFDAIDGAAAQLGLAQTQLRRHFMDFSARSAGVENTTSAADMTALLIGIGRGIDAGYGGVSAAGCRRIVGFMRAQEDRETIPAAVRGKDVANKTGELDSVRHDVALVGLGTPAAYAVALLSMDFPSRSGAVARLRAIAAQIDARAGSVAPA